MVRPTVPVFRVLLLLALLVSALPSARPVAARPMSLDLRESQRRFAAVRLAHAPVERPVPLALAPAPRLDDWTTDGIPVSTSLAAQGNPQLCPDGAGGAFVAWWDLRNGFGDVFMNRLDAGGAFPAGWNGAGVNLDPVDSLELFVEIVPDGANGALAAFSHFDPVGGSFHDVTIQRLTAGGAHAAGFPAGGKTLAFPGLNGLAMRSDGTGGMFLAVADGAGNVMLLHLDADASPVGGWPASGYPLGTVNTFEFDVAAAGGGDAFVARTVVDTVLCMRFDAGGGVTAGWPDAGVVVTAPGSVPGAVAIGTLSNGDAMLAWEESGGGDLDLRAVRVGASGAIPAPWAIDGVAVNTLTGLTYVQGVTADASGGATIVWDDETDAGGATAPGALHLDASGARVAGWPANGLLLCPAATSKSGAALVGDGAGGVFGVWTIDPPAVNPGVYLQYLKADGTRPAAFGTGGLRVCSTSSNTYAPALTLDGSGGAVLAWEDFRGLAPRVYAAHVLADGTVPAQLALVEASAVAGRVRLHWFDPAGSFTATLVREAATGSPVLTPVHSDGSGDLVFEDADVTAGAEYRYRLRDANGTALASDVTVRVPLGPVLAIEAARPNPSAGDPTLAFSLASGSPARLELIDVAGRRVVARDLAGFGAGSHVLPLGVGLAPGVYTARLTQSGVAVSTRVVVAR